MMQARLERANRFDSIYKAGYPTWKPKQGDNLIRFLPPTWPKPDHYGYSAWTHGWIGPDQGSYLCLYKMQKKPCPICVMAQKFKAAGDEEEARHHNASERVVTWVLDRDGDDSYKPLLFNMSGTMDREILALCRDRRNNAVIWVDNPDEGFDVSFQRTGSGKIGTKYGAYLIARDPSPLSPDRRVQNGILDYIEDNPLPDILQYYPADYIQRAMLAGAEPEQERELVSRPTTRSLRRADPYDEGVTTETDTEAATEDDDYNYAGLTGGKPEPQPPRRTPRATLRPR
jgi:hypothetical protein